MRVLPLINHRNNGFLFIANVGLYGFPFFSVPGSPVSRFCTICGAVRKSRFKSPARLVLSKPRLKLANQYHTTPTAATHQLFIGALDPRTAWRCGRFNCRAVHVPPRAFTGIRLRFQLHTLFAPQLLTLLSAFSILSVLFLRVFFPFFRHLNKKCIPGKTVFRYPSAFLPL